jgi:hypothetical protein
MEPETCASSWLTLEACEGAIAKPVMEALSDTLCCGTFAGTACGFEQSGAVSTSATLHTS